MLDRPAAPKPVAHHLEVPIDLYRVIASPDESEVPLYGEHRARLTLATGSHNPLRSPLTGLLLQSTPIAARSHHPCQPADVATPITEQRPPGVAASSSVTNET